MTLDVFVVQHGENEREPGDRALTDARRAQAATTVRSSGGRSVLANGTHSVVVFATGWVKTGTFGRSRPSGRPLGRVCGLWWVRATHS